MIDSPSLARIGSAGLSSVGLPVCSLSISIGNCATVLLGWCHPSLLLGRRRICKSQRGTWAGRHFCFQRRYLFWLRFALQKRKTLTCREISRWRIPREHV